MLHDVPFVRLKPVDLVRWNRSDVETIDVRRVQQVPLKLLVLCDGRANERLTNPFQHSLLRALHHTHKRKHKFLVGDGRFRRATVHDRRAEKGGSLASDQARAKLGGEVRDVGMLAILLNHVVHGFRDLRVRESSQLSVLVFRGEWLNRAETLSESLRDLLGVSGRPNGRAIDAAGGSPFSA